MPWNYVSSDTEFKTDKPLPTWGMKRNATMTTIPALLARAAQQFGQKAALVSAIDGAISFTALDHQADLVARALLADGLQTGDRVALWAPNMWEWVAVAVGIQRVGGVLVPLNTRLRGGEVADIARRANITRLFSIGSFLNRYYPDMLVGEEMPNLRRTIILRPENMPMRGREQGWDQFLTAGSVVSDDVFRSRVASITEDDLSDIMFTSGTTGLPKGALFDHKRSIAGAQSWVTIAGMTSEDRYCVFGPFSHNASYKAGWIAGLMQGSTIYWPDAYDGASVLKLIAENRITVMPAPPTVWQEVLNNPELASSDISSLRFLSTGATVIPIELMRRLRRETDIKVLSTGYGMTECCGSATHTLPDDDIERVANTVGKPIPGTEVKIVDANGTILPANQPGEVMIRDNKLLIGYLDNQDATREAFDADGWLKTGDVGFLDDQGYLCITDRIKDMFIVGGFNVYPAEIERQMGGLPGIKSCAVIGIPDQRLGEVGHAFIVPQPGAGVTADDIIRWSKANLANYKVPRGVTFLESLPMNSTGKIVKYALRGMV